MRLTLQSVFKFCTFLGAYVNYFSSRTITHCIIILLESKSTKEKKKSSTREWQDPLTALAHAIARARIHPPCLYTGAFGCVVVALALLCAYTIICCHRYIYTTPTPFGRVHLCGERAGDFSTCSDYEWAPRRVGFIQALFSFSWLILRTFGAIAGPWFPPQDKKNTRISWWPNVSELWYFAWSWAFYFTYQNGRNIFFVFSGEHIFIYVISQFALSGYCARLFCIVFVSGKNSCIICPI